MEELQQGQKYGFRCSGEAVKRRVSQKSPTHDQTMFITDDFIHSRPPPIQDLLAAR